MSVYDLHKFLFDVRHKPEVHAAYRCDPEAVYSQYALGPEVLTALRAQHLYRLHTLGASVFLLAPFAEMLGVPLRDFPEVLRAGAEADASLKPRHA